MNNQFSIQATIAVCLSGCGVFDGSEIHEAVLTLYAIQKLGLNYQCFAPNLTQHQVINHLTKKQMPDSRNILTESARIARGEILDLAQADPKNYLGAIFPGGFGVAKNLTNYAENRNQYSVQPVVSDFIIRMIEAQKPMGFICIAPILIPKCYPAGVTLTIGADPETIQTSKKLGMNPVPCPPQDCVVDFKHKVITTPAYLLAQNLPEAQQGIEKLVAAMVKLTS